MKIMVTGAGGFIGSHVIEQLASAGSEVLALASPERIDRPELPGVEWARCDFHDTEAIRDLVLRHTPAACIHLAWFAKPGEYLRSLENDRWSTSSKALFLALREGGCGRLFFCGTVSQREDMPHSVRSSPYVLAKNTTVADGQGIAAEGGPRCIEGRIYHLYGPRENASRFVPYLATNLLAGRPCLVKHAQLIRNFLHVDDVAAAVCKLTMSDLEGSADIGSGEAVTLGAIAMTVAQHAGHENALDLLTEVSEEPLEVVAAISKLSALGWAPRWSLSDGIRATVDWWRKRVAEEPPRI